MRTLIHATLAVAFLVPVTLGAQKPARIESVKVTRSSFNPSARERVAIAIKTKAAGTLSGHVLDRDGYPVRTFPGREVAAGTTTLQWDGRDGSGRVVPDEAYSFRFELKTPRGTDVYFPASAPSEFSSIQAQSYDSVSGVLRYTLPRASRVHIQAGTAVFDAKTKAATGPVLKTLVNREPRTAGSVVEHWTGLDETGTFYVNQLDNFVVAIAATPLPESSVITFGNRAETFASSLARRTGASLIEHHAHSHAHHQGLQAADDITPPLRVTPRNGRWSKSEKTWLFDAPEARLGVSLEPHAVSTFAKQPGRVFVFVDGKKVLEVPAADAAKDLIFAIPDSKLREHVVAVNWVSDYGPVAVHAFRLQRSNPS